MRTKILWLATALISVTFVSRTPGEFQAKKSVSSNEQAIRDNAASFVEAFNRGDAKAIATLWAKDGQLILDNDRVIEGRDAIESGYATFFREHPKATIKVTIDSIRFLGPNVAIEKGSSQLDPTSADRSAIDHYTQVYVKQNGKWLVANTNVVRKELPPDWQSGLAFLLGQWEAKTDGWRMEMKCEWVADKRFLRRKYSVYSDEKVTSSGVQIIGWDPIEGLVTSWMFDSEGGFGRGYWEKDGKSWFIKVEGTTGDGQVLAATNVITVLSKNEMRWQSIHREIEGYELANVGPVRVRKVQSDDSK